MLNEHFLPQVVFYLFLVVFLSNNVDIKSHIPFGIDCMLQKVQILKVRKNI